MMLMMITREEDREGRKRQPRVNTIQVTFFCKEYSKHQVEEQDEEQEGEITAGYVFLHILSVYHQKEMKVVLVPTKSEKDL